MAGTHRSVDPGEGAPAKGVGVDTESKAVGRLETGVATPIGDEVLLLPWRDLERGGVHQHARRERYMQVSQVQLDAGDVPLGPLHPIMNLRMTNLSALSCAMMHQDIVVRFDTGRRAAWGVCFMQRLPVAPGCRFSCQAPLCTPRHQGAAWGERPWPSRTGSAGCLHQGRHCGRGNPMHPCCLSFCHTLR